MVVFTANDLDFNPSMQQIGQNILPVFFSVFLGRSFSCLATVLSLAWE
jgi:hypothetical protein